MGLPPGRPKEPVWMHPMIAFNNSWIILMVVFYETSTLVPLVVNTFFTVVNIATDLRTISLDAPKLNNNERRRKSSICP